MSRVLTGMLLVMLAAGAATADAKVPPNRVSWPLAAPLTHPDDTHLAGLALLRTAAGPKVCWRITLSDPSTLPATAAHLHRNVAGQPGTTALVTFTPPRDGRSGGCVTAPQAVVDGLRKTPRDYMVVVRTADGSVRGVVRPFVRYQPDAGR